MSPLMINIICLYINDADFSSRRTDELTNRLMKVFHEVLSLTDLKRTQPSGSGAFGNVFSIPYLRRFCNKKCSDNVKYIHQF